MKAEIASHILACGAKGERDPVVLKMNALLAVVECTHYSQISLRSVGLCEWTPGDPRAEEHNKLRLALATFALHLDAFEARLKRSGQDKPEITFGAIEPDPSTGAGKQLLMFLKPNPIPHVSIKPPQRASEIVLGFAQSRSADLSADHGTARSLFAIGMIAVMFTSQKTQASVSRGRSHMARGVHPTMLPSWFHIVTAIHRCQTADRRVAGSPARSVLAAI